MSIIYNNQVVAGKYTQQVVADADTVNAGIIKLATEEQVIEGVDNTTAVTPFYLAQKQDKISAGDGIVIDNNEISCTVNPDEQTIVRKDNGTMQCIGQLTKSNTLKFDWEGTQAEYNVAYLNGTIQPDWYCYITDDEEFVDYADVCNQSLSNLRPEGEARFNEKANIDLDNLSEVGKDKLNNLVVGKADKATTLNGYGITDGLNKNQITNCITEIPQRIKLEFDNGVLTLKAGSEVIVPNGFEANGTTPRFDYVVTTRDFSNSTETYAGNAEVFLFANVDSGEVTGVYTEYKSKSFSGTETPTITSNYDTWYDTNVNLVKRTSDNGATWVGKKSLPLNISYRENGLQKSLGQVFNGFGYIGSTIWVDKGVKGLIPNGRNEDGTLRSIEFTTTDLKLRTFTNTGVCVLLADGVNALGFTNESYYEYDKTLNYVYNTYYGRIPSGQMVLLDFSANAGVITSFRPKFPFRAADYNEASGLSLPSSKYIDLTLGASGTGYTAPANGWALIGAKSTATNQYLAIASGMNSRLYSNANGQIFRTYIPVSQGDNFTIAYTMAVDVFKFFYAEGEV